MSLITNIVVDKIGSDEVAPTHEEVLFAGKQRAAAMIKYVTEIITQVNYYTNTVAKGNMQHMSFFARFPHCCLLTSFQLNISINVAQKFWVRFLDNFKRGFYVMKVSDILGHSITFQGILHCGAVFSISSFYWTFSKNYRFFCQKKPLHCKNYR